jgi:Domain of unknown function (DUF397)
MANQWVLDDAHWRKSSNSDQAQGSGCINVTVFGFYGAIRDSKNPDGPKIIVSKTALQTFLLHIKQGQFD